MGETETLPATSRVRGKTVFHETGPWCPRSGRGGVTDVELTVLLNLGCVSSRGGLDGEQPLSMT